MPDPTNSPTITPDYVLLRTVAGAADSLPEQVRAHGMNLHRFRRALIQVIPTTALANPTIEILWWSDAAAEFIKENPALTKAGLGNNIPYEFAIEANGRVFFPAVTAGVGAGESAQIYVAAYGLNHTT